MRRSLLACLSTAAWGAQASPTGAGFISGWTDVVAADGGQGARGGL